MSKFHINNEGNTGACRAVAGKCPFGGIEEHFSTEKEARDFYEKSQENSLFKALKNKTFLKKAVTAGAMTLVTVSLAACSNISSGAYESGQYTSPVTPENPITEVAPEVTEAESMPSWDEIKQSVDEQAGQLSDWLNEHEPEGWNDEYSLKNMWEKHMAPYLEELGGYDNPSVTTPIDGVMWQGGQLAPTADQVSQAQANLDSLVVRAETKTPYNRDQDFGRGFQTGIAGAIEHRDVPHATFNNASPQARVASGNFIDPYTGENVVVTGGDSYDADIDHIVPLKEAWDSGANTWTKEQRVAFANNMDNLVYTASSVNRSKSDKDAGEWLPSYAPAQCSYVITQINIKTQYQLTIDSAEKAAMQQVINSRC